VYLILHLLGAKITFLAALAIEALTKMINIVGLFNPGNIGTYEGGNMLIAKMFGLTATAGLTLGLARRVRAIFWAAVGGLCVVGLSKSKGGPSSGLPETTRLTRVARYRDPCEYLCLAAWVHDFPCWLSPWSCSAQF
jgi:hypothetical protein